MIQALWQNTIFVESGSEILKGWLQTASLHGTSALTFVEMASALSKAGRLGYIKSNEAQAIWQVFQDDWKRIATINLTELILKQASLLAWRYPLRGYDAVHLASALTWQESNMEPITLITFDRQLWRAGKQEGLEVLPVDLS